MPFIFTVLSDCHRKRLAQRHGVILGTACFHVTRSCTEIPTYVVFEQLKYNLQNRAEFFYLAVTTARRDEGIGRVLLGDNTGSGSVLLPPIRFRYRLDCLVYTSCSWPDMHLMPNCAQFHLHRTNRYLAVVSAAGYCTYTRYCDYFSGFLVFEV